MGGVTRRRIVTSSLCLLAGATAAGCNITDSSGPEDDPSEIDTTESTTTQVTYSSGEVFSVERVSLESTPSNPINVSGLSDEAERKAMLAIEDGVCVSGEPSLRDHISDRSAENHYFVYNGSYYGIFYRVSDVTYARTASSQACQE